MKIFKAISRNAFLNADCFGEFYLETDEVKGKTLHRIIGLEKNFDVIEGAEINRSIVLAEFNDENKRKIAFNSFLNYLTNPVECRPFRFWYG